MCGESGNIARKCHQRKGKKDGQRTVIVVVKQQELEGESQTEH
jgi:hypothetical protein